LKSAFFKQRVVGRGNVGGSPGIRRRPASLELLAVTAQQIDQATQEMSKFGGAGAHAELAGAGLI
jgi:hypothetical protein